MKIISQIDPQISKRYLRRMKYKLNLLSEKFKDLISTTFYLTIEGYRNKEYVLKTVFNVKGAPLVVTSKGSSLDALIENNLKSAHRLLVKHKDY